MTNNKQQDKSAFLLSLASYMGGIREGWRRMRGEVTKRTGDAKVLCVPERREVGWGEGGATREVTTTAVQYRAKGSQTSFERFLRSLPRVDAVDRTVDWVLATPDNIEEREPDRYANLPSQRMLRKTHKRTTHISKETEHHIIDTRSDESVLSGVSWSRYESERGTVGRGTPPVQREDRPRLDLLLQQIHRQQERMAVAADMDTPLHRPHYVQHSTGHGGGGGGDVREELRRCGWGKCRVTTPSQRQLVAHVMQHTDTLYVNFDNRI
ncbi:hypothetical protein GBAR_LOCUS20503 [Geodia barretti]|uniref:Uncharacterized protein n=1 Tax=Geodia barretti TaxID=519541 RepID=A0AA35X3E6_GEOBA|nr:hypothetical protein GBAR_LOCUS20503 [Geodia barretti]